MRACRILPRTRHSRGSERRRERRLPKGELGRTWLFVGMLQTRMISFLFISREELVLTVKPNLSKLSLVIATAKSALEKIQAVINFVRKLLYESSKVFFSSVFGST